MTHTASDSHVIDVGPKPRDQVRIAGAACALGGLVLFAGAVATQIIQASTSVSELRVNPLGASPRAMETLVLTGVLAWQRSRVAGSGRAARVGLPLTAVGTALIVVGHFASLPVRNETIHETGAQVVSGIFGAGTVVSAVGLVLAGWATLRAGVWQDWRRHVPLTIGVVTVALVGLGLTKALPTGVAVYSLGFAALGFALMQERQAR